MSLCCGTADNCEKDSVCLVWKVLGSTSPFSLTLFTPVSSLHFIAVLSLLLHDSKPIHLRKQDERPGFLRDTFPLLYSHQAIHPQFSHMFVLKTKDTRETAITLNQFKVDIEINIQRATYFGPFPLDDTAKFASYVTFVEGFQ